MNIKIVVGTKNQAKVDAVSEILHEYPHLSAAKITAAEAVSNVSDQPKSLEETIQGAKNRARSVFKECNYSIGIESGLMHVPGWLRCLEGRKGDTYNKGIAPH